jgi:hypothetical protein
LHISDHLHFFLEVIYRCLPFPDTVTVGTSARLLGGSGTVAVGVAAPRPATVAKTAKTMDLILARGKIDRQAYCQENVEGLGMAF